MRFIDILSLSLSILGIYGLPTLHSIFASPQFHGRDILGNVRSCHACTQRTDRHFMLTNRHGFENQFLRMRTGSHRSPGIFHQIGCHSLLWMNDSLGRLARCKMPPLQRCPTSRQLRI